MTTIACDRKSMAADSRTSWDADHVVVDDKIEIINGSIIGCAGSVPDIWKFLEWFRSAGAVPRPELEGDDFLALELNESGLYLYMGSTYPSKVEDRFAAFGSGGMAAKAAMLCGKTAEQAVKIAILCDKNSGGPVRSVALADVSKRSPKIKVS